MATMDNDAKSCYDRIVANLALQTSHSFGVPSEYCQTVGDTLQKTQFRIRTAMGDSERTYAHSPNTPIHGVGQGGTASPAFWLLVSSVLFDCYQEKATGMAMRDPTNKIQLQQWLEAIVDDTSLFANLVGSRDVHTLVRILETDTQIWERLLSTSGGCLELSKCFYYVLSWNYTSKGDPYPMHQKEIDQLTTKIQLQELGKSTITSIATKEPSEAHKTLGVRKSMDGNTRTQEKVLTQRSNNMASIVATSGMYPYQADVAVRMIYTPAMGYSLPGVPISQKALDKIQLKALESFVPAMGFNKKFPRAIILGPEEFGGEGVPHLYTEACIQKIDIMMMHLRFQSPLGKLIRICLNWLQVNIGTGTPFFETKHPIKYVTTWFTGVHEFLLQINATLRIKDLYLPILERHNDSFLMYDIPRLLPELSSNQLRYINNWRLYYKVMTISDLTVAADDAIHPVYLQQQTEEDIHNARVDRQSKIEWPFQPLPTETSTFKLWLRVIRKCYLHDSGSKLRRPLGSWIVDYSTSQSTWTTYMTSGYLVVYKVTPTGILYYTNILRHTSRTTTFEASSYVSIDSLQADCFPVDSSSTALHIIVHHNKRAIVQAPICVQPVITIQDAIDKSPWWQKMLLQHFRIYDVDELIKCFEDKTCTFFIVSDGGYKDYLGSFGVAIGTYNTTLCQLEGPAPGHPELGSLFRSEAYGMLAGLLFLKLVITTYAPAIESSGRTIKVYCDNEPLVIVVNSILSKAIYPRFFLGSDADVILQIQAELQNLHSLNIIIHLQHVKGHQDDHVTYDNLPREAQLNVEADLFATNYLQEGKQYDYEELPANPISLYIMYLIVTRDLTKLMRYASRSPDLRIYMLKKYQWKDIVPDLIWWQIHGSSIRSLSRSDRRRIRKYIFGWLPTCARLKKYEKYDNEVSDLCQSCGQTETQSHILKFSCAHRVVIKEKWFEELKSFLTDGNYTPVSVGQLFLYHIMSFCSLDVELELPVMMSSKIQQAADEQNMIGWQQVLWGRLAFSWSTIIADHLVAKKVSDKAMTAKMWGKTVVKLVFELLLLLWQRRNIDAHLVTSKKESQLTQARLIDKIEALQASDPDIRYCDRDLIFQPMEKLNQYSVCNLIAWHKVATRIIHTRR